MKRICLILLLVSIGCAGALMAQQAMTITPLENGTTQVTQLDQVSIGLRHLLAADHKDRLQEDTRGRGWRDKLRITIVLFWYQKGWIKTWPDQYAAGYILMRGGQPEIDHPEALRAAYQLFYSVKKNTSNALVEEECSYLLANIRLLIAPEENNNWVSQL